MPLITPRWYGYGGIYVEDGVAAQTLNATPGTYDKLTGWTSDFASEGGDVDAQVSSDQIVVKAPGHYLVAVHISANWTTNRTIKAYLYVDGGKKNGIGGHCFGDNATHGHSWSFGGLVACPNGNEVLDVRATGSSGSESFTLNDASFTVLRVG